jgi:hypothetical protein
MDESKLKHATERARARVCAVCYKRGSHTHRTSACVVKVRLTFQTEFNVLGEWICKKCYLIMYKETRMMSPSRLAPVQTPPRPQKLRRKSLVLSPPRPRKQLDFEPLGPKIISKSEWIRMQDPGKKAGQVFQEDGDKICRRGRCG